MSIAGLGLIGAGAHAIFTTSTVSSQNITSGTLSVVLNGPAGSGGQGTTSLTLPAVGPTPSSFTTGDQVITITNNGDIPASEITEAIGTTYPASDLATQLSVCEVSSGTVIYNGLLSGAQYTQSIAGTIDPTFTDSYIVNIYAGSETTACGAVYTVGAPAVLGTSTAPDLNNLAEGETITVSVTLGYQG